MRQYTEMSIAQMREIIVDLDYKPGTTFYIWQVYRSAIVTYTLQVFLTVPDAYDPASQIEVQSTVRVPPFMSDEEDEFITFISTIVRRLEMHEVDEWFKYKGKHVVDPHPELTVSRKVST